MKAMWEAIRRMFTLPARYNSIQDIRSDPVGAIDSLKENIRQLQILAAAAGSLKTYEALGVAVKALEQAKSFFQDGKDGR